MKQFFILSLLTLCTFMKGYSQPDTGPQQNIRLTKKRLQQFFPKKAGVYAPNFRTDWTAYYNKDSTYHTADTILLYSDIYYLENNSCDLTLWTFHDDKTFSLSEAEVRREPPLCILEANNSALKIKLSKSGRLINLFIYKDKALRDKFTVVSLVSIEAAEFRSIYRITMVRQKKDKQSNYYN